MTSSHGDHQRIIGKALGVIVAALVVIVLRKLFPRKFKPKLAPRKPKQPLVEPRCQKKIQHVNQQLPSINAQSRSALLRSPAMPDGWLIATIGIALVMSILATWYAFQHHYILLYNDAYAHLRIARAMLDNVNPGLVQLGSAWLPLPHLLMLPLIWNDFLWHTGLAGSIPSMISYVITASYLFLAARRLTRDSPASFVGVLAFIINPNVLYLQTTPLGEIMVMASITVACFYALLWIQEGRLKYLLLAAASTCLATLIRYDGWALFPALLIVVALSGWLKRQCWNQIAGNLLAFGVVGASGIGLWLLWEKIIAGDPFYFLDGPYSSKAGQAVFFYYHSFYTYHNLWKSCQFYLVASFKTLGPLFFVLAMAGAITLLVHVRRKYVATLLLMLAWLIPLIFYAVAFYTGSSPMFVPEFVLPSAGAITLLMCVRRKYVPTLLIMLAWLVPFGFYVVAFYTGSVPMFVPEVVPSGAIYRLFNVRYAVHMVAPGALFLAVLAKLCAKIVLNRYRWLVYGVLLVTIVLQAILTSSTGILALQDGLYGVSCAPQHQITVFLAQHYDGGRMLDSVSATNTSFEDAGIDLKNIIYEASGTLWQSALSDPSAVADWVVIKQGDTVSQHINVQSPAFLAQFSFVMQEATGLRLYHRRGAAPLLTRAVPGYLLTEHRLCGTGGH